MTDAGWAERKVEKARLNYSDGEPSSFITIDQGRAMLLKEHARSVRICRQARMLKFHGLRDTDTNEWLDGYEAACCDILTALQRGRGGKW
jgi:hypothetical protein